MSPQVAQRMNCSDCDFIIVFFFSNDERCNRGLLQIINGIFYSLNEIVIHVYNNFVNYVIIVIKTILNVGIIEKYQNDNDLFLY